jgi:hypothetical protein
MCLDTMKYLLYKITHTAYLLYNICFIISHTRKHARTQNTHTHTHTQALGNARLALAEALRVLPEEIESKALSCHPDRRAQVRFRV